MEAPMKKHTALRKITAVILALSALLATGCARWRYERYDRDAAIREPYRGTLENGDTYYTPATKSCVSDKDRTVLYYNELILVFTKDDLSEKEIDAIAEEAGGEAVGVVSGGIHAVQIKIPKSDLSEIESLAEALLENEDVIYACPEYPLQIMGERDPWADDGESLGNEKEPSGSDWWAEAIGAYTAWEYMDSCEEISVGIVDNGFSTGHCELKGQITMITENTADRSTDHGSHVAGIMAAHHENGEGIMGIAPNAHYYCADMWPELSDTSFHTIGELLAVYNYMAELGVRVVNNSWGCVTFSESYYKRLDIGKSLPYDDWMKNRTEDIIPTAEAMIVMMSQLIESGYEDMIFVQAAGNGLDGIMPEAIDAFYNGFFSSVTEDVYEEMNDSFKEYTEVSYEDVDKRILIVGAVENVRDGDGNYYMTDFSNYGETVDICAPGGNIYSTVGSISTDYEFFYGTSMASPMVCGAVAYVWSLDTSMTVDEVRSVILEGCTYSAVGIENSAGETYPMLNLGEAAKSIMTD